MAALVMVFFMDEKIRLNLQDFAFVIIINLAVSLSIVLFLVPALMEKLGVSKKNRKRHRRKKRWNIRFNRFYKTFIQWTYRFRGWIIAAGILAFGLPVFMLPDDIQPAKNKELSKPAIWYNQTLGSEYYKAYVKPIADVVLGGSLRLFVQKVYDGSYWENEEETSLMVTLSMPNGSTLSQTNELMGQMENFLRSFREIKLFQTKVDSRSANIDIRFEKEYQRSAFPYTLKADLISKAVELGGGSWGVFGFGDGFSNDIKEGAGSYRIKMFGYNYDNLYALAEQVKDSLLQHRRIKEVSIDADFSWYKSDYQEFIFKLNKDKLIREKIQPQELYGDLSPLYGKDIHAGSWISGNGSEAIRLYSRQAKENDIWKLNYFPGQMNHQPYRLSGLAGIEKFQSPQSIDRENQQYRLCLQYEYIGSYEQGQRVLDVTVEQFKELLPMGYSIDSEDRSGKDLKENHKQYALLFIIMVIIYFTTSILFNSLKQPFAILLIIPISFIGLFLTFYGFKLNFDQGGFAAFVLLCGITVNAGIYVMNQYNNVLKAQSMPPLKAYIRAWNLRIIPISLTVLSTILGFTPFLIGEQEGFWFPLAAGTIGGLVLSLVGLFVFLPLFMGVGRKNDCQTVITP
jgi:multidrug efflux pump subunit AcrB